MEELDESTQGIVMELDEKIALKQDFETNLHSALDHYLAYTNSNMEADLIRYKKDIDRLLEINEQNNDSITFSYLTISVDQFIMINHYKLDTLREVLGRYGIMGEVIPLVKVKLSNDFKVYMDKATADYLDYANRKSDKYLLKFQESQAKLIRISESLLENNLEMDTLIFSDFQLRIMEKFELSIIRKTINKHQVIREVDVRDKDIIVPMAQFRYFEGALYWGLSDSFEEYSYDSVSQYTRLGKEGELYYEMHDQNGVYSLGDSLWFSIMLGGHGGGLYFGTLNALWRQNGKDLVFVKFISCGYTSDFYKIRHVYKKAESKYILYTFGSIGDGGDTEIKLAVSLFDINDGLRQFFEFRRAQDDNALLRINDSFVDHSNHSFTIRTHEESRKEVVNKAFEEFSQQYSIDSLLLLQ